MVRLSALSVLSALLTYHFHVTVSQSTTSAGTSVQDDWVLPARPDKADYFLNGDKITIEWTGSLYTWFNQYAPDVDPTECDLWVTGWELHQYEHQVGRRVNAQARTSIDWVIDLPSAELNATEWWVFRFAQVNANTTLEGLQISSPGFGVRDRAVPPSASTETEDSSSTTPTTSSTQHSSSSSVAGEDTTGTAAAAEAGGNEGLGAGAKAGIGVGAAIGAFALVGAGWFVGKKWRGDRAMQESGTQPDADKPPMSDAHNRSWGNGPSPPYIATPAGEVRYAELETTRGQGVSELGSER